MRVEARGFNSKALVFVGPWAKYLPIDAANLKLIHVGILAGGGRAHVALGIETAANYQPTDTCRIAVVGEVRLAEVSSLSKSIPVKLYQPTPICTKIESLQMDWPKIG